LSLFVFSVFCLFVCLLATLRKNFQTDFHEIFREGWQWAVEQILNFDIAIRITDPDSDPNPDPDRDIGKTALAEICTVPVLLIAIGL